MHALLKYNIIYEISALNVCFQVSDADTTKNITLKLINTNGSPLTTPFSVSLDNSNSNASITVNAGLDYEVQQRYIFLVTTEQGQGSNIPFTSATVTVNVLVSTYM